MNIGTLPVAILGGPLAHLAVNNAMPMASMKFSREFENEADLLGIQYLWKAGYDPNASIDLFEALASTEKRQPGKVAKLFRAHPLTPERIEKTQKNIDKLLPARPDCVLNTSEYEEIRARLEGLIRKPAEEEKTPVLRRDKAAAE
jgi:beta-barrel assembly-enhancing protease